MKDDKKTNPNNNQVIERIRKRSWYLLITAFFCMVLAVAILLVTAYILLLRPEKLPGTGGETYEWTGITFIVFAVGVLLTTYRFKVRLRYFLESQIDVFLKVGEPLDVDKFEKLLSCIAPKWAYVIDKPKWALEAKKREGKAKDKNNEAD